MWRRLLRNIGQLWQLLGQEAGESRLVTLPETTIANQVGVMYGLNQWVRVKDYDVCVTAAVDQRVRPFRISFDAPAYQAPDLILDDGTIISGQAPADGPRILFVNVAYRNPTVDKTLDCRRNQWFLYDSDGYSYEAQGSNRFLYDHNDKPFLGGTRYINPGMKARGWLAFELNETAVPEQIQFVDGFLRGNTAEFLLVPPPPMLDSG